MKLTFRDLARKNFVIEAEPSETIAAVKEKISQEKGWETGNQKLIYSGKILQDQNTVESYNIEEKGYIVCMVSKPKEPKPAPAQTASPAKPPSTPATASQQTPAVPAAPAPSSGASGNVPTTPSPAPGAAPGETLSDSSGMALGGQREAAIAGMESMGFPRADIERAMRAAFFNPDRAVEYLLNGIPESVAGQRAAAAAQNPSGAGSTPTQPANPSPAAEDTSAPPAAAPSTESEDQPINLFEAAAAAGRGGSGGGRSGNTGAGGQGGGSGAGAGAGGAGGGAAGALGNLEFLRNNPQFQQLRRVVQSQPEMLETILQQVSAGNPQLAQLISAHPEQFLQLLSEDVDDDAALPPGAQQVSVTEEERAAIERLCTLGFDRDLVIQAYFACDKNEDLAANFLFDQPDDPEE
ncbi:MAG: hypothetical protein M4579_000485 [Chaenotheca gracillima]|nr:MAG: hypothetical protein M4579_000485 [Chaenotheca gracillima]